MNPTATAPARSRRALRAVLVSLLIGALAIAGAAVYRSASATVPTGSIADGASLADVPPPPDGAVTEEDGLLPSGATAFDEAYPGIAGLSHGLRDALQRASHDAAAADIIVLVNSGWRSAEYQDQLLQEAVSHYGSAEEAARWVASSATSAHVAGDAIDVGSYDAVDWLTANGAAYGLCQTYGNESWHFELRPEAINHGCPAPYADPAHDPRMHG